MDLLAVQRTFKSLLQHHNSKASILRCSAFFIVQLSHPYMTTGKTIFFPTWTFVGKVMSLLFNMLSRLVIAFLPRKKHLLISWLQSPSAVILESPKIKSLTISIVSPSICHEVMGSDGRELRLNSNPESFQDKCLCFYVTMFLALFLLYLSVHTCKGDKNTTPVLRVSQNV